MDSPHNKIALVRDEVCQMLKRHKLPLPFGSQQLSVPDHPCGDGTPYLSYENNSYVIIIEERGVVYDRYEKLTHDEAVRFFIFEAARRFGLEYELSHREQEKYSRWNFMKPTIDAMASVSDAYGQYALDHYKKVLQHSPLSADEIAHSWYDMTESFFGIG